MLATRWDAASGSVIAGQSAGTVTGAGGDDWLRLRA
jgi:hypothetical protein